MLAGAVMLSGCAPELSPIRQSLGPVSIRIEDSTMRELNVETPPDAPVMVTVSGRGVDVKAAIVPGDAAALRYCDAPNRRMGVEVLLVEPPHAPAVTVRIVRNDHAKARGEAIVEAAALPLVSEADQARLFAARQDAAACLAFPDLALKDQAASAYSTAAAAWGDAGERRRQGLALLHEAGARYVRHGNWRASADLAGEAFGRLERAKAPPYAAYALRLEGAALDQLANAADFELRRRAMTVNRARDRLTEAAERFDRLGMPFEAGYALSYRGVSFETSGDWDESRADFEHALERFRAAADEPAQAVALQSLANQSFEDGRSQDAARQYEQALALIPRDEEPANYAHTLHNSAIPLRVLGRFDEAIERHHEAARILRALGDRVGEARALHSLGLAMFHLGDLERAAQLLRTAIRLRGETGARNEQAAAFVHLAEVERAAGRADVAARLDRQALALSSAPVDRARALLSLARDHLAAGQPALAREPLERTLRLDLPRTNRIVADAMVELAQLEFVKRDRERARRYFAQALAIHQGNGAELDRARTLERRAAARLRSGDVEGALADVSAALSAFEDIGIQALHAEARAAFRASYRDAVELRITALLRAAASQREAGNSRDAERNLWLALAASDRARAQLLIESAGSGSDAVPPAVLDEQQQVYELLAGKRQQHDRLLDLGRGGTERALVLARDIELLRARARLLESRIAKSRAGGAGPPAHGTGLTRQSIPKGVVVAEYFIGRHAIWLFEARADGVTVHELASPRELERLARELHLAWRSPARGVIGRNTQGNALAERLFGPLGQRAPAAQIWIVPDGVLHLVPMALLARRYWERLPPGAALVIPALATVRIARAATAPPPGKLAVIADPVYQADDPRIHATTPVPAADSQQTISIGNRASLRRLAATASEAREITEIVGDASNTLSLLGPDASRDKVTGAALHRYRIVHFATHAFADGRDPALATLALSQFNSDGQPQDGALRLYDIARMRLNADLVVLSGCDTGLGHEIAGEGPIGLSHAFLRGGARAVVSTLWQVPDSSTAILMRELYRQMLDNHRAPAAALELAQEHVRSQVRWSDPYFWAGFQLISNARLDAGNNNDVAGREES